MRERGEGGGEREEGREGGREEVLCNALYNSEKEYKNSAGQVICCTCTYMYMYVLM